jgi:putative effector of murein hydrolase LrgA (UPF0299 family)
MKLNWFKRNGIAYLPASIMGWIILLIGFAFSVYTFIEIDSRSHSVSDTLINFVFRVLIIIAVYSLIAFMTSSNQKK